MTTPIVYTVCLVVNGRMNRAPTAFVDIEPARKFARALQKKQIDRFAGWADHRDVQVYVWSTFVMVAPNGDVEVEHRRLDTANPTEALLGIADAPTLGPQL